MNTPSPYFFTTARGTELLASFNPERVPHHVAVIMDGNGRWAKAHKKPRLFGHKAGAGALKEVILTAKELGVKVLTVYSFSSENWSRPKDEVGGLMKLFADVLLGELDELNEEGVRVSVIGDISSLPKATMAAFEKGCASTAANSVLHLVVALNYGARTDIVNAVKTLAARVDSGELDPSDINEALFSSTLSTGDLPNPDLLIRTSGEMRLSNFLLWESAYTELYVTDQLWPDFNRDSFLEAVISFQSRDRRFGGLGA